MVLQESSIIEFVGTGIKLGQLLATCIEKKTSIFHRHIPSLSTSIVCLLSTFDPSFEHFLICVRYLFQREIYLTVNLENWGKKEGKFSFIVCLRSLVHAQNALKLSIFIQINYTAVDSTSVKCFKVGRGAPWLLKIQTTKPSTHHHILTRESWVIVFTFGGDSRVIKQYFLGRLESSVCFHTIEDIFCWMNLWISLPSCPHASSFMISPDASIFAIIT